LNVTYTRMSSIGSTYPFEKRMKLAAQSNESATRDLIMEEDKACHKIHG